MSRLGLQVVLGVFPQSGFKEKLLSPSPPDGFAPPPRLAGLKTSVGAPVAVGLKEWTLLIGKGERGYKRCFFVIEGVRPLSIL